MASMTHPNGNTQAVVCAHAGCEGSDQDSLESVTAAIEAGADVVEVDVRFTKTGRAVLHHDAFPESEEGKLPSLEDALLLVAAAPGIRINLDLKEHDRLGSIPGLLERTGMVNRAYFTGTEPENVEAVRAACPGIPFAVDYSRRWLSFKSVSDLRGIVLEAKWNGAFAFNLNYRVVTRKLIDECERQSFPVHVWTVDKDADMRRMIGLGVESITTRRVRALLGLLAMKGTVDAAVF